jgi:hypothetical protein
MKRQNFLIFCMVLFLFSGCTSSPMVLRQPDLSQDVKTQEGEVNKDGISLKIKCIHLKSEMKTYFDRDLLYYGILPVQISLQNKSYPRTVVLDTNGLNLIDMNGDKNPMMSCDQIIEKRKETLHYGLGTTMAVWNPLGFIGLSIDRLDKKKKIQYSFKLHSIKFGNLISGGVTEGFAFFSIPQDLSNLFGWKISVILKDTENNKDIILDYALSGNIVPPKERSIWQEDFIDPF